MLVKREVSAPMPKIHLIPRPPSKAGLLICLSRGKVRIAGEHGRGRGFAPSSDRRLERKRKCEVWRENELIGTFMQGGNGIFGGGFGLIVDFEGWFNAFPLPERCSCSRHGRLNVIEVNI